MSPCLVRERAMGAARLAQLCYAPHTLVAIRKRLGMTQVELARVMEVGERTLMRWEAAGLPYGPPAVLYRLIDEGRYTPVA